MNKKTIRIAGWALGLSMAVAGIGVAALNGAKAPKETRADSLVPGEGQRLYTFDFTTKPTANADNNFGGVTWTAGAATNLNGFQDGYKGVQLGKSNAAGSITFTTKSAWGEQANTTWTGYTVIKKVAVWLNNGSGTISANVSIGGTACTSQGTVSKNTSASGQRNGTSEVVYTPVTGHDTGVITIALATSSKAGYFCSFQVLCEQGSTEPEITFDSSDVNLKTNNSSGVTKSVSVENVENAEYLWVTDDTNITLEGTTTNTVTIKPNTDTAGSATVSLLVTGNNIDDFESSFTVILLEPASYTITVTANNCTYSGDSSILEGEEGSISFTPNSGYNLPASVTSITGATVKTFEDGLLTIQNPTANVFITMTAVKYKNDYSIVEGGRYKIHHTKKNTSNVYYIKSNGSDSVPSATLNSWEATIFTFTIVGDNEFYIKNGSNYLYTTNTNNGLRVGDTVQSWKIGPDTTGKTGAYELQNGEFETRYLALYATNDFRTYTIDQNNRTENTDLTGVYDAAAFAQDVLDATDTVCSVDEVHSASDFADIWAALEASFNALPEEDKTTFVNALRNASGTVLEQAAARYDRVGGKYSLKNFATGRTLMAAGVGLVNQRTGSLNDDKAPLIITVIAASTIVSGGLFFLQRKHRKED